MKISNSLFKNPGVTRGGNVGAVEEMMSVVCVSVTNVHISLIF